MRYYANVLIIAGWTHGVHPAKKDHVCCIRIGILAHLAKRHIGSFFFISLSHGTTHIPDRA